MPGGPRRVPATLQVAGIALIAVIAVDAVLKHEHGMSGDEPFYDRIAAHPGGPHSFPYAYRVAVPWLVHVLPFSRTVSFTLLAWLAIAAGAGALFALLREFDVDARLAAAFAIGFALSPPLLVVLLRHGRSVDPASVLVLIVGCLTIVRRQRAALAATILIGVAVRESSMYLVPLAYAVWARRLFDREALKDTVLVGAGPAIAYVLVEELDRHRRAPVHPGLRRCLPRDPLGDPQAGTEWRQPLGRDSPARRGVRACVAGGAVCAP